jgi:LacI family transcriptional regulator
VAELAKTSPAVVSYVLNNGPRGVADATRARVLAAVEQLHYRPNTNARALTMARGHVLGIVVPDSANPYFAALAHAVERRSSERGYPLLIANAADDDARAIDHLHAFTDRQVEGVVMIPTSSGHALLEEIRRFGRPLVFADRSVRLRGSISVTSDGAAAARLAVEHLIGHGHTRIACLGGPVGWPGADRVRGYREALTAAGLTPAALVHRPFDGTAAHGALDDLLASAPTAVFAASDQQAIGILRAAWDRGLRVPADLAIVSLDGSPSGRFTTPGLTTVDQHVESMGRLATDLLLSTIDGDTVKPGHRVTESYLVARGSCGCDDTFA